MRNLSKRKVKALTEESSGMLPMEWLSQFTSHYSAVLVFFISSWTGQMILIKAFASAVYWPRWEKRIHVLCWLIRRNTNSIFPLFFLSSCSSSTCSFPPFSAHSYCEEPSQVEPEAFWKTIIKTQHNSYYNDRQGCYFMLSIKRFYFISREESAWIQGPRRTAGDCIDQSK